MDEEQEQLIIISMPSKATTQQSAQKEAEQRANLAYVISQHYSRDMPVYISTADIRTVNKEEIIKWRDELNQLCNTMGWNNAK